jgi:hypothetical protein
MYDYLAKIILLGPSGAGKYVLPLLSPSPSIPLCLRIQTHPIPRVDSYCDPPTY